MNFKIQKVVIIGINGYLGSFLANQLFSQGLTLIGISSKNQPPIPGVLMYSGGIHSDEALKSAVSDADLIIYLAGQTSINDAERDPLNRIKSGILPISSLIKHAVKLNKKIRIIYASTVTVYGANPKLPICEASPPLPETNYDLHKIFCEQQLLMASKSGLIDCNILRLSNVYGNSLEKCSAIDRNIISRSINQAINEKSLNIYGTGKYLRDFIHISDVINVFIKVINNVNISSGIYNIGTGRSITIEYAYKYISNYINKNYKIPIELNYINNENTLNKIDLRNHIIDVRKIISDLNWHAETNFESGVSNMIDDYFIMNSRGY